MLLVASLGWLAPCAVAQEPTVELVTGDNYPPFADPNLPGGGLAVELVTQTFDHAGLPWRLTFEPWARGYQLTLSGARHATFPYFRDSEREAEMRFPTPLFRLANVLFVNANHPTPIETLADLSGKTLCLPQGYTTVYIDPWLKDAGVELHRPETLEHCFLLLGLMRVDGVPISDAVGWAAIRSQGLVEAGLREADFREARLTLSENWLHLIVSKSLPQGAELLRRFDEAWTSLAAQGAFDQRVRERAGEAYAREFIEFSR